MLLGIPLYLVRTLRTSRLCLVTTSVNRPAERGKDKPGVDNTLPNTWPRGDYHLLMNALAGGGSAGRPLAGAARR